MPSNAAFHPTIETVGFQAAFSVKGVKRCMMSSGKPL
jgi:hypothetical protein